MQLPSIDKNPRTPVKPAGAQVKQIRQTDEVHPRDYAFEMDKILEEDSGHKHQPPHEFGEDTYEAGDENPESEAQTPTNQRPDGRNRATDHDDSNIDISI